MIGFGSKKVRALWTVPGHPGRFRGGASNTSQKRSRPVSVAFVCPIFVGSSAEYKSLTANRRGLTFDRLLAPGTRAQGRRSGVAR